MRRSSVLLVVVALLVATAVTAGASTGSKAPPAAGRGVTATSVKVGGLGRGRSTAAPRSAPRRGSSAPTTMAV